MANYLVTGGAGFIGSHLADSLLEKGHKVVVVDNFDEYYSRKIKEQNISNNIGKKNYIFIEGDLRSTNLIEKILKDYKITKIFHVAARAGIRSSVQDPQPYFDLNVNGTISLLKASLNVGIEKIVFASSSSVYGIENYLPIDEKHPTIPISPYGASKLAAEAFCHSFAHIYNKPLAVLRYFTVYGPRQRPDMAIYKFFFNAKAGKEITIYGDGNQTRDFTFVSDIVEGTIKAMESNATGIFNLGSGQRVKLNDVLKIIETCIGKPLKLSHIEKQKGDVPDTFSNIDKARKAFGYDPKVKINEGIKIFYSWFEKNVVNSNSTLQ